MVPDLRIEKHVRIRELVYGRVVLVTLAVILDLSPLPVRGLGVESARGGHRRGRYLPECDHLEIGRGLLTSTVLGETGLDPLIDTSLAKTALGVTGRVLRTATDHVVSVRVPQLVEKVGVTGRGHTIPLVALVTARGHAIDDLPPLTARGLGRKDDEPDEISRRVVSRWLSPRLLLYLRRRLELLPLREGLRCRHCRLLCRILPGSFLNLAGSSSLGAVGGVAGVAASAAGSGVPLCPSTAAGGAVTLGAATAIPAGVGVSPAASAAVPGVSGLQQRQEDSRSRRRRCRSSSDGTDKRVKKRPRRRSPSPGPSSRRPERHYRASSSSSGEDRADPSPPRTGRAPGGTPGDVRSSRALDRSPHPGTSRSGARDERYHPGAGHRSPAPSEVADDDRSSAFESVDFDRDDSFRSVLGLIRSFHGMEEPAGVPSARCKTSLASIYGLMTEVSPAFSLPASPLVRSLLDDTNLALAKFLEDQTVHGFLPVPGRRHRRYYLTSSSSFPGPYSVPPGITSITLEKVSEAGKRSVSLSASQVSSLESMLCGVCEVSSWLDWWLSTCGDFREHLPDGVCADFERLMLSGSRALEFLASQGCTALCNFVLSRRDSLLADVRSTVPAEEVARLRYAPLPETVALFPTTLLDSALTKMRAAANDALVQRTLHPPRIPRKPAAVGQSVGSSAVGSSAAGSGQASSSGTRPAQKQLSSSSPSGQSGKKKKNRKGKAPFSSSSGGSGRSGGKGKGAGKKSA